MDDCSKDKGKNFWEKIENKFYWGVFGALLTVAFGVIGLYSFFHAPKPGILFEIINVDASHLCLLNNKT